MRKGLLIALTFFATVALAPGQKSPGTGAVPVVAQTLEPPVPPPIASLPLQDLLVPPPSGNRLWASGEYLVWSLKNSPIPSPLVTTGNPAEGALAGTLGQPDTHVLFGGNTLNDSAISGARLTLGRWFTADPILGAEFSAFYLQRTTTPFQASADGNGNPPLYLPAFNAATQKEASLIIADPVQQFTGNVAVTSNIRLWGAELNGVLRPWSRGGFDVMILAGFRYLDLQEDLQLQASISDIINNSQTFFTDEFNTRNQFYGGQVGARINYVRNRFFGSLTGKLAAGATQQTVEINGNITQQGTAAPTPGTFAGGFYTQPTNLGRRTHDDFSLVPQLQVRAGCELVRGLRAFVGYDLLFWNNVLRPGEQIDRNLNLTQSPVFGTGTLVGPAAPVVPLTRSDFWAQGVSFGLEFRY